LWAFRTIQPSSCVGEQASTTSAHDDDDDDFDDAVECVRDAPASTGTSPRQSAVSEDCGGPHAGGRPLAVYCRDCDEPMCESCFIRLHNGHRYANVDDVAGELRDQLKKDAVKLASVALDNADRLTVMEVPVVLYYCTH